MTKKWPWIVAIVLLVFLNIGLGIMYVVRQTINAAQDTITQIEDEISNIDLDDIDVQVTDENGNVVGEFTAQEGLDALQGNTTSVKKYSGSLLDAENIELLYENDPNFIPDPLQYIFLSENLDGTYSDYINKYYPELTNASQSIDDDFNVDPVVAFKDNQELLDIIFHETQNQEICLSDGNLFLICHHGIVKEGSVQDLPQKFSASPYVFGNEDKYYLEDDILYSCSISDGETNGDFPFDYNLEGNSYNGDFSRIQIYSINTYYEDDGPEMLLLLNSSLEDDNSSMDIITSKDHSFTLEQIKQCEGDLSNI